MIGKLWTTGIMAEFDRGWLARCDFQDDGFAQPIGSIAGKAQAKGKRDATPKTTGQVMSRYYQRHLSEALDALIDSLAKLGIELRPDPVLYYDADKLPAPLVEVVQAEAARLGWRAVTL
jgi:hypothetical protein